MAFVCPAFYGIIGPVLHNQIFRQLGHGVASCPGRAGRQDSARGRICFAAYREIYAVLRLRGTRGADIAHKGHPCDFGKRLLLLPVRQPGVYDAASGTGRSGVVRQGLQVAAVSRPGIGHGRVATVLFSVCLCSGCQLGSCPGMGFRRDVVRGDIVHGCHLCA